MDLCGTFVSRIFGTPQNCIPNSLLIEIRVECRLKDTSKFEFDAIDFRFLHPCMGKNYRDYLNYFFLKKTCISVSKLSGMKVKYEFEHRFFKTILVIPRMRPFCGTVIVEF